MAAKHLFTMSHLAISRCIACLVPLLCMCVLSPGPNVQLALLAFQSDRKVLREYTIYIVVHIAAF